MNHYHELPGWAETQPDPVVRDVPTNPKAFDGDEGGPPGGGGGGGGGALDAYGQARDSLFHLLRLLVLLLFSSFPTPVWWVAQSRGDSGKPAS